MLIEIIVQHAEDAKLAEEHGANRLELVTAMTEGGLTPSYGIIKDVVQAVSIPVHVMVRPHGYSFTYSEDDKRVILEDVKVCKELGATGIVFGSLTENGEIDEAFLKKVINVADGMKITFHRAIDEAKDIIEAYKTLQKYSDSIQTVLTSGGAPKAIDGVENLKAMLALSREKPSPVIMPGSGLSHNNIVEIHQKLQATEYHFGSAVRINGKFSEPINGNTIKKIREILG
ncbi:copper homeostasis protein CutC [Fredinandcohnia sp. QZ13]|uniref:copper homeostasis protein CutC n=1 Tax=Fredinandcohnia sp. QZ13 TaxID=3073144 RepID=UPI002852FC56|nr:copper homeostasis protein CutC [Fredinandcohnia sp. QZ13]MDR4886870.1 copper homeostasis protein CutC [Fredinandcohnia sp. QZ13]